jgi:hypothetical protein
LIAAMILNLPRLGRAALFALLVGSALIVVPKDTVIRTPGTRIAMSGWSIDEVRRG